MDHLKALGRGLAVMAGLAVFTGMVYLAVDYPIYTVPPLVLILAWFIGGGADEL